jgi:hypothetical protein
MGDEDGRWRLVRWTLEDLEATQGSSSVRSAGLKSILSSGYVHDVHIDPQNFVSAWVESDHNMKRQSTKKKKQAGGRAAKPLDTARLARQRPKDTRLVGGAVGPRARRTPAHLKDYATPPPSAATARRGPTTR